MFLGELCIGTLSYLGLIPITPSHGKLWFSPCLKHEAAQFKVLWYEPVTDPGWGWRQPVSLGQKLLIDKTFAKNCMKMKEIGPRGGANANSIS